MQNGGNFLSGVQNKIEKQIPALVPHGYYILTNHELEVGKLHVYLLLWVSNTAP